jgi:hypothetical protein
MELLADAVIPYPRTRVFAAYRDGLVELARYLPNIRSIQRISCVERGDEIDLVNEWTGGGDIPAVARSILKESMLRWTDHATWFEREFRVLWRSDIHAFPGAVKTAGENHFIEIAAGTRLAIRGHFTCDASKIPGVPRLLAKPVSATIEKVMVGQIAKNTVETARGVARLIAEQDAARG